MTVGNALLNLKEVFDMGPKVGKVTRLAAAALAALALSTGAEATVIGAKAYSASGGPVSLLTTASDFIDIAGLTDFDVTTSLGFSVTTIAPGAVTVSTDKLALQTLQVCATAGALCGASGWTDVAGSLNLGGTSFTHSSAPGSEPFLGPSNGTFHFTAGLPGVGSLRVKWNADDISPAAAVSVAGSLQVTTVPEPGAWAMMLAGIIGVAGIARRRIG